MTSICFGNGKSIRYDGCSVDGRYGEQRVKTKTATGRHKKIVLVLSKVDKVMHGDVSDAVIDHNGLLHQAEGCGDTSYDDIHSPCELEWDSFADGGYDSLCHDDVLDEFHWLDIDLLEPPMQLSYGVEIKRSKIDQDRPNTYSNSSSSLEHPYKIAYCDDVDDFQSCGSTDYVSCSSSRSDTRLDKVQDMKYDPNVAETKRVHLQFSSVTVNIDITVSQRNNKNEYQLTSDKIRNLPQTEEKRWECEKWLEQQSMNDYCLFGDNDVNVKTKPFTRKEQGKICLKGSEEYSFNSRIPIPYTIWKDCESSSSTSVLSSVSSELLKIPTINYQSNNPEEYVLTSITPSSSCDDTTPFVSDGIKSPFVEADSGYIDDMPWETYKAYPGKISRSSKCLEGHSKNAEKVTNITSTVEKSKKSPKQEIEKETRMNSKLNETKIKDKESVSKDLTYSTDCDTKIKGNYYTEMGKRRSDCEELKNQFSWLTIYKSEQDLLITEPISNYITNDIKISEGAEQATDSSLVQNNLKCSDSNSKKDEPWYSRLSGKVYRFFVGGEFEQEKANINSVEKEKTIDECKRSSATSKEWENNKSKHNRCFASTREFVKNIINMSEREVFQEYTRIQKRNKGTDKGNKSKDRYISQKSATTSDMKKQKCLKKENKSFFTKLVDDSHLLYLGNITSESESSDDDIESESKENESRESQKRKPRSAYKESCNTKLLSSKPITASPQPTNASSKTTSAKSTSTSPKSTSASSRSASASSKPTSASPRSTNTSPNPAGTSQRLNSKSPKPKSTYATSTRSSPKSTGVSPKFTSTSPKQMSASPKSTNASQKPTNASPKSTGPSPKFTSTSPKQMSASSKPTSASPKSTNASPKPTNASPQLTSTSPRSISASVKPASSSTKPISTSYSERSKHDSREKYCKQASLNKTTESQASKHANYSPNYCQLPKVIANSIVTRCENHIILEYWRMHNRLAGKRNTEKVLRKEKNVQKKTKPTKVSYSRKRRLQTESVRMLLSRVAVKAKKELLMEYWRMWNKRYGKDTRKTSIRKEEKSKKAFTTGYNCKTKSEKDAGTRTKENLNSRTQNDTANLKKTRSKTIGPKKRSLQSESVRKLLKQVTIKARKELLLEFWRNWNLKRTRSSDNKMSLSSDTDKSSKDKFCSSLRRNEKSVVFKFENGSAAVKHLSPKKSKLPTPSNAKESRCHIIATKGLSSWAVYQGGKEITFEYWRRWNKLQLQRKSKLPVRKSVRKSKDSNAIMSLSIKRLIGFVMHQSMKECILKYWQNWNKTNACVNRSKKSRIPIRKNNSIKRTTESNLSNQVEGKASYISTLSLKQLATSVVRQSIDAARKTMAQEYLQKQYLKEKKYHGKHVHFRSSGEKAIFSSGTAPDSKTDIEIKFGEDHIKVRKIRKYPKTHYHKNVHSVLEQSPRKQHPVGKPNTPITEGTRKQHHFEKKETKLAKEQYTYRNTVKSSSAQRNLTKPVDIRATKTTKTIRRHGPGIGDMSEQPTVLEISVGETKERTKIKGIRASIPRGNKIPEKMQNKDPSTIVQNSGTREQGYRYGIVPKTRKFTGNSTF